MVRGRSVADHMVPYLKLFRWLGILPFNIEEIQKNTRSRRPSNVSGSIFTPTSVSVMPTFEDAGQEATSGGEPLEERHEPPRVCWNVKTLVYCSTLCLMYTSSIMFFFSLQCDEWSRYITNPTWAIYTWGVVLADAMLMMQPVLCLWCIIAKWPKIYTLLQDLSLIDIRESDDSLQERSKDDSKHHNTSCNLNATSLGQVPNPRWWTMEVLAACTLSMLSWAMMVLALLLVEEWRTTKLLLQFLIGRFLIFFANTLQDVLFFTFNCAVRRGFALGVNQELKQYSLDKTSQQPGTFAIRNQCWKKKNTSKNDAKHLLHQLDVLRVRHGMLSEAAVKITHCFSLWVKGSCGFLLLYLIMAAFSAIQGPDLYKKEYLASVAVALAYVPPTLAGILRMLLLCRSASKLKNEERETGNLLAAIQNIRQTDAEPSWTRDEMDIRHWDAKASEAEIMLKFIDSAVILQHAVVETKMSGGTSLWWPAVLATSKNGIQDGGLLRPDDALSQIPACRQIGFCSFQGSSEVELTFIRNGVHESSFDETNNSNWPYREAGHPL